MACGQSIGSDRVARMSVYCGTQSPAIRPSRETRPGSGRRPVRRSMVAIRASCAAPRSDNAPCATCTSAAAFARSTNLSKSADGRPSVGSHSRSHSSQQPVRPPTSLTRSG
jgi:hypothetical protein